MNILVLYIFTVCFCVNIFITSEAKAQKTLRELINARSGISWVFTDLDNYQMIAQLGLDVDEIKDLARSSLIYPGTKWCGAGNIAEYYDDLGSSFETDACCREHDHCPDIIPGGGTGHNLTNSAFYTRLSCECDEKFQKCLLNSGMLSSKQIGAIYFNLLGTKCFRRDYPVTGCQDSGGWINKKCLWYRYNRKGKPYYQWFDVPSFFR